MYIYTYLFSRAFRKLRGQVGPQCSVINNYINSMLLQQGTQQLQRFDGSMKTIRCMPPLGFDCTLVYYKLAFSAAADPHA